MRRPRTAPPTSARRSPRWIPSGRTPVRRTSWSRCSTGAPERIPERVAGLGAVLAKPYDPARLIAVLAEHRRKPGLLGRLREALAG